MSETKYTPGPWRMNDGNQVIADRQSHELLAMAPHIMCQTCESNARLIAAAPDLLEALQEIEEACSRNMGLTVSGAFVDQIEAHAKAAIAKALGS